MDAVVAGEHRHRRGAGHGRRHLGGDTGELATQGFQPPQRARRLGEAQLALLGVPHGLGVGRGDQRGRRLEPPDLAGQPPQHRRRDAGAVLDDHHRAAGVGVVVGRAGRAPADGDRAAVSGGGGHAHAREAGVGQAGGQRRVTAAHRHRHTLGREGGHQAADAGTRAGGAIPARGLDEHVGSEGDGVDGQRPAHAVLRRGRRRDGRRRYRSRPSADEVRTVPV